MIPDLPEPPQTHYEYVIQEPLAGTAEELAEIIPEALIGYSALFTLKGDCIVSTPAFSELIAKLQEKGILLLEAEPPVSIAELNAAMQQEHGGLLRRYGTERWEMIDPEELASLKGWVKVKLDALGLTQETRLRAPVHADSCLIFAARVERMRERVSRTLALIDEGKLSFNQVYLLGGSRKLTSEERQLFPEDDRPGTEFEAFVQLWETALAARDDAQELLEKTAGLNAVAFGATSPLGEGVRPTTESTLDLLLDVLSLEDQHVLFAIAEKPYTRLLDQALWTAISSKQRISDEETLLLRARSLRLVYSQPASVAGRQTVYLDEIARQVYNLNNKLSYLRQMKQP